MSAEIPSDDLEARYPTLRQKVKQYMMHPTDHLDANKYSRCNRNKTGVCQYHYPQQLRDQTTVDEFGRPLYRRRQEADRMVVPYCPLLLMEWDGHLNFEVAFTVNAFLYLYKYIFKGPDSTRFAIESAEHSGEPNLS